MSRSVKAFERPPLDSMMRSYSLGGTFFEPLTIRCSKKWEIPVIPSVSLREPTRYHCQKVTAGTLWSSWNSTTSPLDSACFSTGKRLGLSGAADAADAAAGFALAGFAACAPGANASPSASVTPASAAHLRLIVPPRDVPRTAGSLSACRAPYKARAYTAHMPLPSHLARLALECDITAYRSSGPGGQKKNKTESSVRVRHRPSGITRIATESRSQGRNRALALERVWEELKRRARKPKPRVASRPSAAPVERRLVEKRHVAERKRVRRATLED